MTIANIFILGIVFGLLDYLVMNRSRLRSTAFITHTIPLHLNSCTQLVLVPLTSSAYIYGQESVGVS